MPYWFAPLGRRFALRADEIADRAERWIVQQLGYTDQLARDADSPLAESFDYQITTNDHGSMPRVERLHVYLEYHAMLLVAGELVDERHPVVVERYDELDDPWSQWLGRHLDASPDRWSADLRVPVPLAAASYGQLGPPTDWRQRHDRDSDAELGLALTSGPASALVVDSSRNVSGGELYGSAYVAGALVAPETAWSLLSALQTCEDPNNFALPNKVADGHEDTEINEPPFVMSGWIREAQIYELGLEEHDPLRRIGLGFAIPGNAFAAYLGLHQDLGGRVLRDDDGRRVAWVEAWSDERLPEPRPYYSSRDTFSADQRTWVSMPHLLDFLNVRGPI